jgi:hemolysin D
VLAAEQTGIEADRDLAQQRHRIAELLAAITAKREERSGLEAEFRRQVEEGLHAARADVARYRPRSEKAEHRDSAMRLVAPVDGTVQQLAVHTIGGVVTPAQPLLAIVPAGEDLEVEALVLNRDIGFVRAGQAVVIKLESFPYRRYGMIDGEVLLISHDAMPHEHLGLVYKARIRLLRRQVKVDGVRVRLSAGMNVTAEMKTGQRRVIEYLVDPLRRTADEAMRER